MIKNSLLIICIACCLGCKKEKELTKNTKPNIIFLLTDDQRWDALGINGNRYIKTPNIDSLANSGFNFKNAYVTTSICMVSRASILTGQYMSRHGINGFHTSLENEALNNTYPALLKSAGYTIGFIGKYGIGNPPDHPKKLFDYWKGTPLHQPNYETVDKNGDSIHYTDLLSQNISEFLNISFSKPFCLSVSFKAPHSQDGDERQFIPKTEYAELYENIEMPLPTTADSKYWDSLPSFFHTEENIARIRWKLRFSTEEKYQESVKNYYRLITGVDESVGKLREELKKSGQDNNTVIIFMGDNGMYLGEHGLAGKWFAHEESIRVPLIIYDPRNEKRLIGALDEIGLNIDIAPTILGFAGVEIPESMQGHDLTAALAGNSPKRKQFFYEHTFNGSPSLPETKAVISPSLKYVYYPEFDFEELFDLNTDPNEVNNLASDSKYLDVLEEQRQIFKKLKNEAN
ncbi:sulfatase family protein [Changchengzhania lutea]|uniref:sulfatase family protein n=1 Tax=Changchengzhania lutea TaxID=2049305 RepID=UPI00115EE654|nr:sulfatase [Changchengzhania lutea]